MTEPILTIGELEPLRPTVAIGRNAPDGRWQRFKYDHFDVLLRWMPVRFAYRKRLYPLRAPSEFGLRSLQRMRVMQEEIAELQGTTDKAAAARYAEVLREMAGMVLVAPPEVIGSLHPIDLLRVLEVFPRAVTGRRMPTTTPRPPANPPTSDASSPASTASTAPETG